MAKKTRTPPPPRRVQAPQRRHDPRTRTDAERRKLLFLGLFGASGIVALGIVIAVIAGGGSGKSASAKTNNLQGSPAVAAAVRAAGGTYIDVAAPKPPKGQGQHIASLTDKVDWNTYPPAGGQHYSLWAVWNFYTDAVDPKQVVHNEEHGAVVLWWGPKTPASEIAQLRAFYDQSPNSMFGTPIGTIGGKSLGSKVAITAWTGNPSTYQHSDWGYLHVAILPKFDEHAFTLFRDAYRGHGPEGIPTSSNNPGEGP
ncbi:MAG: DUF3105 domain-containing protein [Gaiellaceae bacterium]